MDPNEAKNAQKDDPTFPELTRRREFDRGVYIKKAMEAGLPRDEAGRHADEHFEGRARLEGQSAEDAIAHLRELGVENPDYRDEDAG